VTYTGPLLDQGATLAGPGAVDVWASSSNTNLQLLAQVLDIAPDGTETSVMRGSILGSRLRSDPVKSWTDTTGTAVRPYLTLQADEFLQPDNVVHLQIPLQPTVRAIPPGHRLALRLSTQSPSDLCALSANIGPPPVACEHTAPMLETLPGGFYQIFRGAEHPSAVNVPLLPYHALPTSRNGVATAEGPLPGDW
jgi:predicted acyl esterase